MSTFKSYGFQNQTNYNNITSQCPSEVMSTFTVEDKISLLMSNQSHVQDVDNDSLMRNSHRNWLYNQSMAKTNKKIQDSIINSNLAFNETGNTQKNQFNNNGSRTTEHHFIKTIYLKKLSNDGQDSQKFSLVDSNKRKSTSQSVCGGGVEDKSSSHNSSNQFQNQVTRSVCGGGGLSEEKLSSKNITINIKTIHLKNFKQLKNQHNPFMSATNSVVNHPVSEIGSVFQSQSGESPLRPQNNFEAILNVNLAHKQRIGDKNMSLQQILEQHQIKTQQQMPSLRRRICKKSYEIFYQEKNQDKNVAKSLALITEELINNKFNYQGGEYMKVIKSLFKKIRVSQ